MPGKVISTREAVGRLVRDGASVALGCALEPAIPFAFAHEVIRQRRQDLHLIGPISDIAFDQLIGAGCVGRISAAWVGNVSAGLAHAYRRAMEEGMPRRVEVRDHSNFTIAQALLAGAVGAPYLPTRTLLGSDIPRATTSFFTSTTAPRAASKGSRPGSGSGSWASPTDPRTSRSSVHAGPS